MLPAARRPRHETRRRAGSSDISSLKPPSNDPKSAKTSQPASSSRCSFMCVVLAKRQSSADRRPQLSVPPPDLPMPNAAALFPLLPARTADRTHLLSASIHPYPSSSGPREYAEAVTTLGLGGPRDWIKSRKALSSSVGSGLTSSVLSTTSSAFPPQASVEHPDAAIVERAKDVCLELRRGPSAPEEQDARGSASFVAVLEMSTDWTFQGPGWPFAVRSLPFATAFRSCATRLPCLRLPASATRSVYPCRTSTISFLLKEAPTTMLSRTRRIRGFASAGPRPLPLAPRPLSSRTHAPSFPGRPRLRCRRSSRTSNSLPLRRNGH